MLYATVRQRKIYVKKPTTVIQNGVGVDELTLDMDAEWGSMDSIICVFTLKYTESTSTTETGSDGNSTTKITTETKEITKQMLHTYGTTLLVPWECLVKTGLLSVSCTGYVGSTKIMTTMLPDSFWNVVQNGAITGDETIDPTPTLYQQIVAAAGAATTAAAAANDAAAAANDAATTAKSAAEKIKDASGADGVTPSLSIGTVETLAAGSDATASITGTDEKPVLNLGIPKGADGSSGSGGGETWELIDTISLQADVESYILADFGVYKKVQFLVTKTYKNVGSGNIWLQIRKKGTATAAAQKSIDAEVIKYANSAVEVTHNEAGLITLNAVYSNNLTISQTAHSWIPFIVDADLGDLVLQIPAAYLAELSGSEKITVYGVRA